MQRLRLSLVSLWLLFVWGCAQQPELPNLNFDDACLTRYAQAAGTNEDAVYAELTDFPFLRTNRSWASADVASLTTSELYNWLAGANAMALEAAAVSRFRRTGNQLGGDELAQLKGCGDQLVAAVAADTSAVKALAERLAPAELYQSWARWLGLYPLSRIPFSWGVAREIEATQQVQQSYLKVSLHGWRQYGLTAAAMAESQFEQIGWRTDFKGIDASALLRRWAPSFAVEPSAEFANDVAIGVGRSSEGELNAAQPPLLYSYLSVGQFAGAQTLQLNYQLWFPQRAKTHATDLLAGRFDAIHWRVHLDQFFQPIAFDAMHACGCWYQLYPAQGYRVKASADYWQERIFVGQALATEPGQILLLRANTHALIGVRNGDVKLSAAQNLSLIAVAPAMAGRFEVLSEAALGYRALFDQNGILKESRRNERYIFWPMGIKSAGAMRAPGHHAIAFVGRRYFDTPELLENLGLSKLH